MAVSRAGKEQWTYITEEAAFDMIVWKYAYTTVHGRRTLLTTRAKLGDPKTAGLDVVLPTTLEIDVLVSRVVGSVHDNNYVVRRVTLVKRDDFYAAHGGDASTFANEFLYGNRRDLGKAISENGHLLRTHVRRSWRIWHKSSLNLDSIINIMSSAIKITLYRTLTETPIRMSSGELREFLRGSEEIYESSHNTSGDCRRNWRYVRIY